MIKSIIFFILVSTSFSLNACPIDPFYRVAKDYETFLERADAVFLGKLESYELLTDYDQLATFTVIKSYKSDLEFGQSIVINNNFNGSCSRGFHPEGTAFYVFANKDESGDFFIEGYATFVPMDIAIDAGMELN